MNRVYVEGLLWKDWTVVVVDDNFAPPGSKQAMAQNTIIDGYKSRNAVFFDIVLFGPLAEEVVEITQKGDRVIVKGVMVARRWFDEQKVRRARNVLLVRKFNKSGHRRQDEEFAPDELFKFSE